MATFFPFIILLLFLPSPPLPPSIATPPSPLSPHLLDALLLNYSVKNSHKPLKTGVPHSIPLPSNLSGISVTATKFRCGSLHRYGAHIDQFTLPIGVSIHPCIERIFIITITITTTTQILTHNYSDTFNLTGYRLVSPILSLLAYNAGDDHNQTADNMFELKITAGPENPIRIEFSSLVTVNSSDWTNTHQPYCAAFDDGIGGPGKVTVMGMAGEYVCEWRNGGHFGIVVESEVVPAMVEERGTGKGGEKRWWKVGAGSVIGAAMGVALLGFLVVAMAATAKGKRKRMKMEEMMRKAYEEEALQVSMVGHVRAHVASCVRTWPSIEDNHGPRPERDVHHGIG